MSFDIVETQLSGDVANAGTFTVGYPTGRDSGDYTGGINNLIESTSYGRLDDPEDVSFSFDAALITITNNTGQTLAQGTDIVVQLDRIGADDEFNEPSLANEGTMAFLSLVQINLGAPDVADANGYVESQDLTALGVFSVDVTAAAALLAAALLGVADNPRNVVAAWTGTAIMTVTGVDEYGVTMVESSGSGTSMAGKKAFKEITDISVSGDVTGLTVGTGDVLGLPMLLSQLGQVVGELEDGAAATAGTIVKGDQAAATATTGDVRGTVDPNSAADGAKSFQIQAILQEPSNKGGAQYGG